MGCTPSKEPAPSKPKREILYGSNTQPLDRRSLPDPAPKHVAFELPDESNDDKCGSGGADPAPKHVTFKEPSEKNHGARGRGKIVRPNESRSNESRPKESRPKETFEAYAQRGVISQSAIAPEEKGSKRTRSSSTKKRVGGFEKYP